MIGIVLSYLLISKIPLSSIPSTRTIVEFVSKTYAVSVRFKIIIIVVISFIALSLYYSATIINNVLFVSSTLPPRDRSANAASPLMAAKKMIEMVTILAIVSTDKLEDNYCSE
jgi:hypothetical protein